LSVNREYRQSS